MRARSSKMRVFSFDRYIRFFPMKFSTGFKYRNLHGFARFPGDSTALVLQTAAVLMTSRPEVTHGPDFVHH